MSALLKLHLSYQRVINDLLPTKARLILEVSLYLFTTHRKVPVDGTALSSNFIHLSNQLNIVTQNEASIKSSVTLLACGFSAHIYSNASEILMVKHHHATYLVCGSRISNGVSSSVMTSPLTLTSNLLPLVGIISSSLLGTRILTICGVSERRRMALRYGQLIIIITIYGANSSRYFRLLRPVLPTWISMDK